MTHRSVKRGAALRSLSEFVVYRPIVGRAVLLPVANWGQRRFETTGRTPRVAYVAMRRLYGNADATLFDLLLRRAGAETPSGAAGPAVSPHGGVAAGEIDRATAALERDGFVVLTQRLDAELCDDLEATARRARCSLVGPSGRLPDRLVFDEKAPVAVRYDVDEEDVLESEAAQLLVADESLLEIATRYLGTTPVQDLVAMWWSTAVDTDDGGASDAAQQFHFDLDRLKFVKVFVFLTDVTDHTGPHVYVRGTHRSTPRRFRRDGRYPDADVLPAFGTDVRTIAGPRGTIFIADTRGLHKGMPLVDAHRLVFQTEYASSLFGSPYTRPRIAALTGALAAQIARHPHTFGRFLTGGWAAG
jgi:hypothetical protein